MVTRIALIAIVAISISSVAGPTDDPDGWSFLATSHDLTFEIRDRGLVRDQPKGKRIVSVRVSDEKTGYHQYINRYNVDCTGQPILNDYRTFFDQKGGTIDGYPMDHLERLPATLGTIGGIITERVCG